MSFEVRMERLSGTARALGLSLTRVAVSARGPFEGTPSVSAGIEAVEVWGEAPEQALRELVARVDAIAEIPNSLRRGTAVRLSGARVHPLAAVPAGPGQEPAQ